MNWLMLPSEVEQIESYLLNPIWVAGRDLNIESYGNEGTAESSTVEGDKGFDIINIEGPLLPQRNKILSFLGVKHTAYSDINSQLEKAQSSDSARIVLRINSPGGSVEGMLPTMQAIAASKKPVSAEVQGMCASAAYSLASQASDITASSDLDLIGSVGVMLRVAKNPDEVVVTNSASPQKNPDVTSDEGRNIIKAGLDDVFDIIAEHIAAGRKISVENMRENYGKGATMTARKALKNGLIDSIGKRVNKSIGGFQMNEEEKKVLVMEARQAGMQEERNRVLAHLLLAQASGDMATAISAIQSGDGITELVKAAHMAAEIKQRTLLARQLENPSAVSTATNMTVSQEELLRKEFEAKMSGTRVQWSN